MVDERSSLTRAVGKTKKALRNASYGSTNSRNDSDLVETKQKYRKLNQDDMYYNFEADSLLDSINRRYRKIVFMTYSMGLSMIVIGCLLVL